MFAVRFHAVQAYQARGSQHHCDVGRWAWFNALAAKETLLFAGYLILHANVAACWHADTFATVLLPDEGSDDDWEVSEEGVQPCPDPWCRRSQSQGLSPSAAAAKVVPCGEEEVVPLSALVQARLGGVCLQLDSFADQQEESSVPAPRVRYALVVRMLEVRDSFQPRQGSGTASAATAAATGWSELRRMLGYHASMQHIRRPRSCMLQLVVEGHCTDLEAGQATLL